MRVRPARHGGVPLQPPLRQRNPGPGGGSATARSPASGAPELGRTVFVDRLGEELGRQLLLVLLESEDERYAWLDNTVCVGDGLVSPETLTMHLAVFDCVGEV